MSPRYFIRFATAVSLAFAALPLRSQTTVWDSVSSGSWFDAANWTNGVPHGGSTVQLSAYGLDVNMGGTPTITLSGGAASTFNLTVGYGRLAVAGPGPANLLITNGGSLSTTLSSTIGHGPGGGWVGSTGSVTLENASFWNTGNQLYVGQTGAGSLNIFSGSTVTSSLAWVGYQSGDGGTVLVDGSSSAWNPYALTLGSGQAGTLTVRNNGTVTVTNSLLIGDSNAGNLVLQSGGTLSVTAATNNRITLGQGSTGVGSITIGAEGNNTAVAPGTLNVGAIQDTTSRSGGDSEVVFNHTSNNYVFAPTITGYISLIHRSGTTILTANHDYYGVSSGNSVTRIYDGTLQLGNGGTTGMITGPVDMHRGTLAFNRSDDTSSSLSIVDSGSGQPIYLAQLGSGDLTLSGSFAPTLNYRLNGGGDVIITSDFSISGTNTLGVGTIEATGSGRLIVAGSLGATFAPVIRSGTLQIGNGGSTGSLGTATDAVLLGSSSATLAFNRADDVTFTHHITGTGIVRKLGTNNLTLSGDLSTTGQFIIEGGTLTLTSGSTFDSLVSGGGTFVKDGTTTLSTRGNFTQTGGTVVKAGTLSLLGAITSVADTSAFTVESGAHLSINRNFSAPVTGAGNVTLGDNTTFSGLLSITGGLSLYSAIIDTGGNANTVGGPVSIGSRLLLKNSGQLTFTGDVTGSLIQVDDSGILRIGNGGTTGTLGANVLLTNSYSPLEIARSDDYTLAATISGNGYLIQAGTGKLTLSADSPDWGGTLRLRAGLLTYATAPTNKSGKIHFEGGALQFNSAFTTDVSSRFSNDANQAYRIDTNGRNVSFASALTSSGGTFTKLGAGTLTLTGANTYTGGTTVAAGTLAAGNASALHSGTTNAAYMLTGGTLNLAGFPLTMSSLSGTGGTLALGGAALNITQSGDTTYAGTLTGSGRLVKNGAGTLTLASATTYAGGTTLNAGTLGLGGGGVLGSGALTINGGTLRAVGAPRTLTNAVVLAGDFTLGRLTNLSGPITLTDNITLTSANPDTGDVATSTISGVISGNYGLTFTEGANPIGALVLSGANTHTGDTVLSSGTLTLAHTLALQNSTFDYQGGTLGLGTLTSATFGGLTGNQSLALTNASSAALALTVGGNNVSTTYSGVLSGGGSLTKTGTGTLTLTSANTHTGGTTLDAGTLGLGADNALGSGTLTINGGNLRAAGSQRTLTNAVVLAGDFTLGRLTNLSGPITLTDNITLTSANPDNQSATTSTISGVISGNYGLTFVEGANPIGTIILSGANTYTGNTTLLSGRVAVASDASLGATTGTLTFDGGALQATGTLTSTRQIIVGNGGGTLDSQGFDTTFGGLNGSGSLTKSGSGALTFTGGGTYTGTLTMSGGTLRIASTGFLQVGDGGTSGSLAGNAITNNGALAFNRSDDVTYAGIITGTGSLTKSGAGTLVLSGANTYTGATNVNIGMLAINGSLANTVVTIVSGATLGGSGRIDGFTTLQSGAHLSAGNSPGTLTFTGGLDLNAGVILDFELGTTSDLVVVSGGTLSGPGSGSVTVNLFDSGDFTAGTYTLIDATGATLSSISGTRFELGTVIDGYTYAFAQNGNLFQLIATSAVPEPSTCALLAGLGALGLALVRRRCTHRATSA